MRRPLVSFSFSPSRSSARSRRGQASFDYLSTYGFAFFSMLVILGVINYFGFFDFGSLRKEECVFATGVSCLDYTVSTADPGSGPAPYLQMIVVNEYGVNLTITSATLSSVKFSQIPSCSIVPAGVWASGDNKTLWCAWPAQVYAKGDFYDGAVMLNFTQQGGSYVHTVSGRFTSKIR